MHAEALALKSIAEEEAFALQMLAHALASINRQEAREQELAARLLEEWKQQEEESKRFREREETIEHILEGTRLIPSHSAIDRLCSPDFDPEPAIKRPSPSLAVNAVRRKAKRKKHWRLR